MSGSEVPSELDRLEREALDVVLAYYAGHATLDAAVRAVLSLSEGAAAEAGEDGAVADEVDPAVDVSRMSPAFRARFEALARAIEERLPDTA